ncbi:MAG: MauE/DoxX family redox-associated membrane protein [Chloroflexia bacterium]
MTFAYYLSLAYVAATLLTSGIGHVLGFARFRALVGSHGIIPARFATLVLIIAATFEVAAGSTAVAMLLNTEIAPFAPLLFAIVAALACAFALYIRLLLRRPVGVTSCGCSPFAGPLTPMSIVPAAALLLMSALGLVVTGLGFSSSLNIGYELLGFAIVLPLAWGISLSMVVFLLPATLLGPTAAKGS